MRIWRLSFRSGLALSFSPHFLSEAFLFLLSMHLFVSGSSCLIWKYSALLPPSLAFLPLSFKVYSVIMRLMHGAHNSL